MDIIDMGTPFGLAFASGLNAYLPLLAFAISVRWLHLYKVNQTFSFITQTWLIAALAILTILDFVADKIPLIDHAWNAIHTVVRPITGALVAAAAGSRYISGIHITTLGSGAASRTVIAASVIPVPAASLLIIFLIGGALAALSHTTKSTTRIVSTIMTAGFLNVVLSFFEDVLVFVAVLLSLFVPVVMFVLLVLFILLISPRLIRMRQW